MISPLSFVKNVRTVYHRFYQKNVKEVEVQFQDEYEDGSAELYFSNPNEQLADVTFEENDIKEAVNVNSNSVIIDPEPKLLLLFPSYLGHQILYHNINTERLSLAFNIMPSGQWGEADSAIDINWFK